MFLTLLKEYNSYTTPASDSSSAKPKISNMAHVSRKLFKSKNGKGGRSDSKGGDDSLGDLFSINSHSSNIITSVSSNSNGSHNISPSTSSASSIFESVRSRPSSVISTSLASFKSSSRNPKNSQKDKNFTKDSNFLSNTISNNSVASSFSGNSIVSTNTTSSSTTSFTTGGKSASKSATLTIFNDGQIYYDEFPHLVIYQLPFQLDLYETFQTTCDVLIDVYRRLYSFVKLSHHHNNTGGQIRSGMLQQSLDPNGSTNSASELHVITAHTFSTLLKADDLLKKLVLGPTVRGVDVISKSVVYEETKRLDTMLRDTQ